MSLFRKSAVGHFEAAVASVAFERSIDAILIMNETTILACNDATLGFLRYPDKSHILSRNPADLSPEFQPNGSRSLDMANEKAAEAIKNGHARFDWVHRRADGSTFTIQVTVVPTVIEGGNVLACYWRDVSDLIAAREEKARTMAQLASTFEADVGTTVGRVTTSADAMHAAAELMSGTATETARQSAVVATAFEQTSASVQMVAGATEQLSASVGEISQRASTASSVAANAVAESERTNTFVRGLAEAAQRVGAVTELIRTIAAQTNLLALNATIEAARAGEAGRGFAVAASEVKSLASQTARATEEIGSQIAAIQTATDDTVAAIGKIGATIGQINDIAMAIAAAVEEQGTATQEIARNVQQAAIGTRNAAGNIALVTRAADETGTASGRVLTAASTVRTEGEQLGSQVARFLAAVRAA